MKMILVNGVQYRPEDAERLGLKADETFEPEPSRTGPVLRAGSPENKAQLVSTTTTGRKPTAAEKKAAEKAAEDAAAAQTAAANTPAGAPAGDGAGE